MALCPLESRLSLFQDYGKAKFSNDGLLLLLLRFKAGAPRTEHYQLVRALSADAVVTVL